MTTEQLPTPSTSDAAGQQWGAPQNRPPQRWSTRKTVASAAIAAAVVAGGGAAIYAASGSTSSSAGAPGGPGGQMMQGGPGGPSAMTSSLHGEYVVSDGNGGYTTELTQTGTVTALSATELTARSEDGYTKTYTIGSADLAGIANGETVTLTATVSGNSAALERVTEGTSAQPRRDPAQGQQ